MRPASLTSPQGKPGIDAVACKDSSHATGSDWRAQTRRPGSAYRPASPSPAGRGGGAFNEDGTLTVADCTIRANVAMGANRGDGYTLRATTTGLTNADSVA